MNAADRQRAYRDRKRGGPARTLSPCGTYAAARRHVRDGSPLCDPCRDALNVYQRNNKRTPEGTK